MPAVVDAEVRSSASWRHDVRMAGWHVGVPAVVAIVVLTALTVGIGLLIVHEPNAGVGALDLRVSRALVAHRSPRIDALTAFGVSLADTVPVTILWVGAMAVAWVVTRRWVVPLFLLVAIGGEKLTYLIAGSIVGRARPPVEPLGPVFSTSSFPSGHTGAAMTLYGGIVIAVLWTIADRRGSVAPAVKVALGLAVVLVAAFVGFSRVWRGQHYPTDVTWGLLLGASWLAVAWWLVLRPAASDDGREPVPPAPS